MGEEKAVSCIFPHSDKEFGVTNEGDWTTDERVSYNRGALRGFLSDILPNRKYAYHYAIHYEMNKRNKEDIKATWEDHSKMLFPIPNHLLAKGTRVYFFYKWEIVGDGLLDKVIYNDPTSEFSKHWDPETYPIIVKFKKGSVRVFPNDSISKEVMMKALSEKTIRSLPASYPVLTDLEERKLQKEIVNAVKVYSSAFL
jgi:hypothetical protein